MLWILNVSAHYLQRKLPTNLFHLNTKCISWIDRLITSKKLKRFAFNIQYMIIKTANIYKIVLKPHITASIWNEWIISYIRDAINNSYINKSVKKNFWNIIIILNCMTIDRIYSKWIFVWFSKNEKSNKSRKTRIILKYKYLHICLIKLAVYTCNSLKKWPELGDYRIRVIVCI